MLKNKKLLFISVILFVISIILNFPFPHEYRYGELIFSIVNIPIQTTQGIQVVGITSLILLITSLFFLARSLKKYTGRFVLLAIVLAMLLPSMLADSYQKTLASGIYAISYDEETSECRFDMVTDHTIQAECEFTFQNYSNDDVNFSIDFYETYPFEDIKMVSLMGIHAPYEANIEPNDTKQITLKTMIDVSNMKEHVETGSASYVNIMIKAGEKVRRL
ncbi:hypothetical protein ACFYKX_04025 [Cytobacillus sp. FJAT-54145]|uniref:Uncharacterized protein n=1 Tax=Cytobacillus spartinae TaxID=3299023 RepID=A0ABW6KAG9_9BACI